jgi:large subunit ribosomal protein L10
MKKEDKNLVIEQLKATLSEYSHFYVTNIEGLNADKTSQLRRECFKKEIKLMVVKNTLLAKALEGSEAATEELLGSLKGNTAIMFCNTGNAPAKVIKDFNKKNKGLGKPELKAAYVEETVFIGANQLDALASIKSKNELIADLVALLQSPAKNVVSALQSGANTIHGVLKTLGEREA